MGSLPGSAGRWPSRLLGRAVFLLGLLTPPALVGAGLMLPDWWQRQPVPPASVPLFDPGITASGSAPPPGLVDPPPTETTADAAMAAQPATPAAPTVHVAAAPLPEDSAPTLPVSDDGNVDIAGRPPTPPSREPVPAASPAAAPLPAAATVMAESLPQRLARIEHHDSGRDGSSSGDGRDAARAGSQSVAAGNDRAANAPRSTAAHAAAFAMPVSPAAPGSAAPQVAPTDAISPAGPAYQDAPDSTVAPGIAHQDPSAQQAKAAQQAAAAAAQAAAKAAAEAAARAAAAAAAAKATGQDHSSDASHDSTGRESHQ